MSEPDALLMTQVLFRKGVFSLSELKHIVRSIVRLQCKPDNPTVERIFFKIDSWASPQAEIIGQLFPDAPFIFATRHPKPSIQSNKKMILSFGISPTANALGMFWRFIVPFMSFSPFNEAHQDEYAKISRWIQNISWDEWAAFNYAACIYNYSRNRSRYQVTMMY